MFGFNYLLFPALSLVYARASGRVSHIRTGYLSPVSVWRLAHHSDVFEVCISGSGTALADAF